MGDRAEKPNQVVPDVVPLERTGSINWVAIWYMALWKEDVGDRGVV